MTLQIDSEELLTILNNQQTAIDALVPVVEAAGSGNLLRTIDTVPRAMELIQQSIKSTHAVIHQVRSRHGLPTA